MKRCSNCKNNEFKHDPVEYKDTSNTDHKTSITDYSSMYPAFNDNNHTNTHKHCKKGYKRKYGLVNCKGYKRDAS